MYFQITTRCNAKCDHCVFNCTHKGEDMSWHTFLCALRFVDEHILIGGGEPTVHRQFRKMLTHLAECHPDIGVFTITNGYRKQDALWLFRLVHGQRALGYEGWGAELSVDYFHDHSKVDPLVREAYTKAKMTRHVREIMSAGRAVDKMVYTKCPSKKFCVCEETFLKPNGNVHLCGCPDSPCVGNVYMNPNEDWLFNMPNECWDSEVGREWLAERNIKTPTPKDWSSIE